MLLPRPDLVCLQVQRVDAVITVKQPWFHPIFLSCFNRLFIKNPQPASNRTARSQPARPETLFDITTVAFNLCLFPSFHATALIFLPAVPVVLSLVWHHHSAPGWELDDPWCTSDATIVWHVFKKKRTFLRKLYAGVLSHGLYLVCISVTPINKTSITELKQTQKTAPPIQDRILQQLDLGITKDWNVAFPFPQMNRCPTGIEAATRPTAQYQAATSWKRVSFRIQQGPQLWLKSRRTPERNSS